MVKLSRTILTFLGLSAFGGFTALTGLGFAAVATAFAVVLAAVFAGTVALTVEAVLVGLLTAAPVATGSWLVVDLTLVVMACSSDLRTHKKLTHVSRHSPT